MTEDLTSVEQTQLVTGAPSETPVPMSEASPEQTVEPVQVVSVDELVERLTTAMETETVPSEPAAVQVEGMDQLLEHMEVIEGELVHPALETPFEDYSVSEGLLLLLLVLLLLSWCVRMIKGGFSWLLW